MASGIMSWFCITLLLIYLNSSCHNCFDRSTITEYAGKIWFFLFEHNVHIYTLMLQFYPSFWQIILKGTEDMQQFVNCRPWRHILLAYKIPLAISILWRNTLTSVWYRISGLCTRHSLPSTLHNLYSEVETELETWNTHMHMQNMMTVAAP